MVPRILSDESYFNLVIAYNLKHYAYRSNLSDPIMLTISFTIHFFLYFLDCSSYRMIFHEQIISRKRSITLGIYMVCVERHFFVCSNILFFILCVHLTLSSFYVEYIWCTSLALVLYRTKDQGDLL